MAIVMPFPLTAQEMRVLQESRRLGTDTLPIDVIKTGMLHTPAIISALAERLGTEPVVFPGDHGGFGVQPEAFAAKLHEVLASS